MRIRVHVTPHAESSGREPVTLGVPLPKGAVRDIQGWTFGAGNGSWPLAQTRVLDRWSDGSIRWVLVDVQVDRDPRSDREFYLDCDPAPGAVAAAVAPIVMTEAGGAITVDTGATRFRVRVGRPLGFDAVEIGGTAVLDAPASGLSITDARGVVHPVTIEVVGIEERGPLRGAVRLTGRVQLGDRQSMHVTARLHFFAGLGTVRLLLTLTNPDRARHRDGFWDLGDPGSVLIKDVTFTCTLPSLGAPVSVKTSPEIGSPWRTVEAPFEIYQDSSGGENWQSTNHLNRQHRVPNTFRGYRLRSAHAVEHGLRATPVVELQTNGTRVAATIPYFWQNFPKAIEATGSSLALRLFPWQYADLHELQGGEQKTHECVLFFGPDGATTEPLEWCRAPAVGCLEPEWYIASGAVPFLASLDQQHLSLVMTAVEGPDRFEQKREMVDEYGWRHFGDIYGDHEAVRQTGRPLVSHYNNQYDPLAGFACQFLRTGDPRWWRAMIELAAHVIDIDIYHTVRDKWSYNHGLFWHTYHYGNADTATHRTYPRSGLGHIHGGGPSADHNYTTGLVLHHLLTGSDASRQAALDLAQFVIDMDDGRKTVLRWLAGGDTGKAAQSYDGYYGPGRGPANSLDALVNGHRLSGAERFSDKADQLIRRVIHPQDDIGRRRLDVPEKHWYYTMFLQSLGRYLQYKDEKAQIDDTYAYARASLLHYARWMAAHEHPYLEKPERLQFPTETWAAQDVRKSDVLYFAAMQSIGEERGIFLKRGEFFFRSSVDSLATMPTRVLARPVAVMLSSGFLHSWLREHPEAGPSGVVAARDFGRPSVFVSQRKRAERRLRWVAVAAAFLLVVSGLLLLRW